MYYSSSTSIDLNNDFREFSSAIRYEQKDRNAYSSFDCCSYFWNWDDGLKYLKIKEDKMLNNNIKHVKVIYSYSSRIDDLTDVVIVEFEDGKKEKSIHKPDGSEFNLSLEISICVAKHACGGATKFWNIVDKGVKMYEKDLAARRKAYEKKMLRRAENDDNISKKAKKKKAARQERISEYTEAFLAAFEKYENSKCDNAQNSSYSDKVVDNEEE